MKKITFLLLAIFYCVVGYSQFPENFEDPSVTVPNTFPAGWLVKDNGVGLNKSWAIVNNASVIINGTKSAYMDREEIGAGNTSEDWLIAPSAVIPTNGQLRFFTKQSLPGNNGTIYQIRVSSGTSQGTLSDYTVLKEWNEAELNAIYNAAEEKVVDFPATAFGNSRFIAFVRVYTQPTAAQGGDRWSIDDISLVQKCLQPNGLTANTIAASSANLLWTASAGSQGYDIGILPSGQSFEGLVTGSSATNNYLAEDLTQNTNYKYYVRSNCGNGNFSEWTGPFNFSTLAIGTSCLDPIIIPSLPYQTVDNTGNYGNTLAGPQLSSCISGGTNYQSGNDVFYSYTATEDCTVSFTLDPTQSRSSMFIYPSCAGTTGACLAAVGNTNSNPRILNYAVTAGSTYIIVISSNSQTPTVGYNLLIQCEGCAEKPTALGISNIGLESADYTWTAPAGTVLGYEVAVQPQGSPVPAGAGINTGSALPGYTDNDLEPATLYQYWVRAECAPGSFSAWAGPFLFNTQLCAPADQCTYTFRMTDSANNGWNGARMQIRQNGIVLETIGSTYNSGAGPVDVTVTVCNNVQFDIFWTVAGSQPQQCIVSVLNSFGQTIATVNGASETVGTKIFEGIVNCATPLCNIAPTNVTVAPITTTGGTINWDAPATENVGFDIYIVAAGSPAPVDGTTPTYSGVNGPAAPFSFAIPVPNFLTADTEYDVYVRVQCNQPGNSDWSIVKTFKTLPTCPKPTNQTVTGITTNAATLGWTEGGTATQWEVLLLKAPDAIAPAEPGIIPTVGTGDIYIQNLSATTTTPALENATIYYYYVRAVCQGNDASTWTGPFIFNTITCDAADKCNFKFLLTNTTNNNWNGGRMQVRQNGIVVATLGTGGVNNANGITVALCNDVPYDLYWSVEGTFPEGIGVKVQTPFLDIVYTKQPGVGTPLTVLYSDSTLGNCTPPSCPKPINMLVNSVTQTTADLSWTETGSAVQWEVYAIPEGGAEPVNGSPLNTGVAGYYLAGMNTNFVIDDLTSGTKYVYYVRAICSPTDMSNWTLLTPAVFITIPANDECASATPVPVNPTQVCTQTVPGNTLGGTASAETAACPGNENDDVWFSFVADSTIHIVDLLNVAGSTTNIRFAVYNGVDCGTMTQIFCSATNNNTGVLTNLTIGNTYKIRVYTNGSNVNQSATFDVCVSTPPPPGSNDECINAIPITVNVLSECLYVTPGNLIGATGSTGVSNACVGTEDDDVWFSFVATSGNNVITLLNVEGTTTNLNHAVYSGTCDALVQLYCAPANTLTSTNLTYTVGQTYYVRVWSNGSNSEVVTFDICVKPISSCGNAAPFCGGTVQSPYIFPNSSNIAGSSIGQVACLFTTPNPTYYTLHVGQSGPMNFTMVQNTLFNAQGQPVGTNLDVDFVAWGPFTSTESCDEIVFGPCPGGCPNNTTSPNFYPSGNIVDCSYSASFTETISIPNAIEGEFYIILLTNYNGSPGFISLVQTNFDAPNAGTTICCDVNLGPDLPVCADSVTLNALEGVIDLDNVPVTFEWYFNGVLIQGQNNATIVVNQSGTYTVKGNCGVNAVEDSIEVTLSAPITVVSPATYEVCDDLPIDGFSSFDLNTLTAQVLDGLDPTIYTVSYYILEADAIADAATAIDLTTPFVNTVINSQVIYIRVESNSLTTCFAVVPVTLEVGGFGNAKFNYSAPAYCKNETPNPMPIYIGGGEAGTFTATPDGLVIDAISGEINLASSTAGTYTVTNTVLATGLCGDAVFTTTVTINEAGNASFTYPQDEYCIDDTTTIVPILTGNATAGVFAATPAGLVLNAVTGEINVGASAAGTYVVTNTIAAVNACAAESKSFTITLVKGANATISYNDPFCTSTSTAEAVTIMGTTGGTFSSTSGLSIDPATGTINPSTSNSGSYTVTYTINNGNSCGVFTTTTSVTIIQDVIIDFTQGCENNAYRLVAQPLNGSFDIATSTFTWTGPGVVATDIPNAIILGSNGEYTVTVTTADGCSATEKVMVNNISCMIQKGISPNNDGSNDFFDLSTLNVKELFIYNRYGTEVYKYGTYTNQWKGQSNTGKELPDGTYFYVIHTVEGENITGWIFINR